MQTMYYFVETVFVSELRFSSNLPVQTLDPALESDSRPRCLSCLVLLGDESVRKLKVSH